MILAWCNECLIIEDVGITIFQYSETDEDLLKKAMGIYYTDHINCAVMVIITIIVVNIKHLKYLIAPLLISYTASLFFRNYKNNVIEEE